MLPILKAPMQCNRPVHLDLPDIAAAQAWATNDPYAKAGLFREVTLMPWNKVIG
jgi:uncharacterized protein YciI